MRNVFGGLSFNLTRVAAEGAPGTSSHHCYDRSGGRRGKTSAWRCIFQRAGSGARSYLCMCLWVAADCCARSATPPWFPSEGTRFLLRCNIWFITIRNSTSVRLLCLKKSSQRPREQEGEKKPTKEALPWNWQLLLCCAIWCICQGTEKG